MLSVSGSEYSMKPLNSCVQEVQVVRLDTEMPCVMGAVLCCHWLREVNGACK